MTSLLTECDGALIELALAGRTECFTILMDRHSRAIRRCIRLTTRNATDTDDVFQEVAFKVWRGLSRFRAESSFRTWVTRIAANEALMLHRRERSRWFCKTPADLEAFPSRAETSDESLIRSEGRQAVRNAVAALPPRYRQVVILRDLEEISIRETARRLDLTIPAVKTRLFRGRLLLMAGLRHTKPERLSGLAA